MPDGWQLEGFHARLVEWVGRDRPPRWLVNHVANWLPTLALDPFHLAHAVPGGVAEVWAVAVPDAVGAGRTVVCSYLINRDRKLVECDTFEWRDDPPDADHLH